MSNNNYIQSIGGFDGGEGPAAFYASPNAGPFNTRNAADGSFAAFCTFYLRGETVMMPSSLPSSSAFLWGNLSGNTGWALHLVLTSNVLNLVASIGTGAAVVAASFPLTATALPSGNPTSVIERLIMAGLWFDGADMVLSVNGN